MVLLRVLRQRISIDFLSEGLYCGQEASAPFGNRVADDEVDEVRIDGSGRRHELEAQRARLLSESSDLTGAIGRLVIGGT